MSTKRRCFDASSFHCGQGAGRYSGAIKKIAAVTRTVNGTMSAVKISSGRGTEMDEKERLTQELLKISKERNGTVSKKQEAEIREFAESFLMLLDDTEE